MKRDFIFVTDDNEWIYSIFNATETELINELERLVSEYNCNVMSYEVKDVSRPEYEMDKDGVLR